MAEVGAALLASTLGWVGALWAVQALQRPWTWLSVVVLTVASLAVSSIFAAIAAGSIGLLLGAASYLTLRHVLTERAHARS